DRMNLKNGVFLTGLNEHITTQAPPEIAHEEHHPRDCRMLKLQQFREKRIWLHKQKPIPRQLSMDMLPDRVQECQLHRSPDRLLGHKCQDIFSGTEILSPLSHT